MHWHDTRGKTYKESAVRIVLERLCRILFSTNMEASKACLFWAMKTKLHPVRCGVDPKSLYKMCWSFSLNNYKADHVSLTWRFKVCFSRQIEVEVSDWKGILVCVAFHIPQQSPNTGIFSETFTLRTHLKNLKSFFNLQSRNYNEGLWLSGFNR